MTRARDSAAPVAGGRRENKTIDDSFIEAEKGEKCDLSRARRSLSRVGAQPGAAQPTAPRTASAAALHHGRGLVCVAAVVAAAAAASTLVVAATAIDLGAGSDGDRPSDGRHRRRRCRRVLQAPSLLRLLHRVRGVAEMHDGRAGAESGTPGFRAVRPAGEMGRVSAHDFRERRAQFLRVHHPWVGVARRTGRVLAARSAATSLAHALRALHASEQLAKIMRTCRRRPEVAELGVAEIPRLRGAPEGPIACCKSL